MKPTDIIVSVTKQVKPYPHTEVRAELTRVENVIVAEREASSPKIMEMAKVKARHNLNRWLYGELVAPLRELELMARASERADVKRIMELRAEIDRVMGL